MMRGGPPLIPPREGAYRPRASCSFLPQMVRAKERIIRINGLFFRDARITPPWEGQGEATVKRIVNPPEVTGSGMWLYVEPLSGMYTHARHTKEL